jgi:hydroxyacylglutathione hydrolase
MHVPEVPPLAEAELRRREAMLLYSGSMSEKLIHEVIPVGLLQCNCSILGDPITHEAIVVDPGDDVERILEVLRRFDLKVRAIVSTHTHIDHVGGLAQLHRSTGAPVLIHEADLDLYRHLDLQAQWLGIPAPAITRIEDFLKEGDTLRWGSFAARVLHTPGHTPGSISLVIEPGSAELDAALKRRPGAGHGSGLGSGHDARHPHAVQRLVAGDTLFRGSIGRTDLWGGSYPQILQSIREKLLVLPDDLVVYPGHGDITTIGFERAHNPFLR